MILEAFLHIFGQTDELDPHLDAGVAYWRHDRLNITTISADVGCIYTQGGTYTLVA